MDKAFKKFKDDVQFVFVYTKEAHPDDGPEDRSKAGKTGGWKMKGNKVKIDEHQTYKDRIKAAEDLTNAGKDDWLVLVDAMDDHAHADWGNLPNMAWLIDPQGRIAHKWSWVGSSTGGNKRNGDDATSDIYKLLNDQKLDKHGVADDSQLPLYDTQDGEWLTYETPEGEVTATFERSDDTVKITSGKDTTEIELKQPEIEKTAKFDEKDFKINGLKLPCIVVETDSTETWYCLWLPGDAIVKVVQDGEVVRELKDAGFKKGESCLTEFDPEAE